MALWRNILTLMRYKANFLFTLVTSALFGLGMLLFAVVFDVSVLEHAVGSTNYVAFAILGVSFQSWQSIALYRASGMLQGELGTGQIDYTFSSPFSRYWYIVSNIIASAFQDTIFFIPMLWVGLWVTGPTVTATGVIVGLIATALSVAVLAQIGTIFAALVLRFRQVTAIFGFFNFAFQMLTGMFIPIQLLPAILQLVSLGLPQTFGMDLLRHYVMGTNTVMAVEYEWVALLIQLLVLGVGARLAVRHLERIAKEQGLHYI